MNLLAIVQEFCVRTGLRKPSSVAGSLDTQTLQFMGLANEIVEDLTDRWVFETLQKEATFTTIVGEDQGAISTIAPNGFLFIIRDTIYDRTQKVPLYGPMSPQVWAQTKAFVPAGPLFRYRIRGGRLLFNPAGVAGHACAFEYSSSYAIQNVADDVYKSLFTKDTDEFLLDYKLLLLGLRWKWKSEKGHPYAEELRAYEEAAANAASRSGVKPKVDLAATGDEPAEPYLVVAPGSWSL